MRGVPAQINAEKSPFLTERLKIWMLPTLALIKMEKTVDYVVGFDELGGTDGFTHRHAGGTPCRRWHRVP